MGTSLAKTVVAVVLGVMLGGPAFASAGVPVQARPASSVPATTPVTARTESSGPVASDADRYAAREASAQQLQDFKGGAAYIYIGGSALALAVLIVLLLVLI